MQLIDLSTEVSSKLKAGYTAFEMSKISVLGKILDTKQFMVSLIHVTLLESLKSL